MRAGTRFFICMIFLLTASSFSFASSVSVFMCQKDGGTESLRAATVEIENSVLDTLFDRGYIVSSVAAAKSGSDFDEAASKALQNSAEGFFDFMVQITVRYTDAIPENPSKIVFSDIQSIEWRIVRIKNNACIAEKMQMLEDKYEGETDLRAVKRVASELGSSIVKALRTAR